MVKTLSKLVTVSKGRFKNNIYGQSKGCQLCQEKGQLNLGRHLYAERTALGGRWERQRELSPHAERCQPTPKITPCTRLQHGPGFELMWCKERTRYDALRNGHTHLRRSPQCLNPTRVWKSNSAIYVITTFSAFSSRT